MDTHREKGGREEERRQGERERQRVREKTRREERERIIERIIERERVEAGEESNHTFRRREKEERRQGRGSLRERVERPGRNRTTPLKADHCQPENKRLTSHHPYPPTPGERGSALQVSCVKTTTTPKSPSPHIMRTSDHSHSENKKFKKRTVQYVRFPGGPPPEYWTRPWLLSFGDRTGSGVSNQV